MDLGFFLLSSVLYIWLLYGTSRHQAGQLLGLWGMLNLAYLVYGRHGRFFFGSAGALPPQKADLYMAMGVAFRLIAFGAIPTLSDDYFRFIWDGQLIVHGVNPFLHLPSELMADPQRATDWGLSQELYQGLNSPDYFTIYPPFNQGIFALAAWLSPTHLHGAVLIMKGFILAAEVGTLGLLRRLLPRLGLTPSAIGIYALNPLVIIELTGNLHFEGLMIFFILLSVHLWLNRKEGLSSLALAGAIVSKLLPLMFLPLYIRRMGWWRALAMGFFTAVLTILLFLPVMDLDTLTHFENSLGLYFQKFEFNASLYYLTRWWGYQLVDYNIIETAGSSMAMLTIWSIGLYTLWEPLPARENLPRAMMWTLMIYLAFAAIVHPWYISTLVALCGLTPYRFPVGWTLLIPLTYLTYQDSSYTEFLPGVALEYILLGLFMVGEWGYRKHAST